MGEDGALPTTTPPPPTEEVTPIPLAPPPFKSLSFTRQATSKALVLVMVRVFERVGPASTSFPKFRGGPNTEWECARGEGDAAGGVA